MRGFRLRNVVGRKVVGVFTAVFEVIGDSIVALLVHFMVRPLRRHQSENGVEDFILSGSNPLGQVLDFGLEEIRSSLGVLNIVAASMREASNVRP